VSSANELNQCNEQLLVGPDWGQGGQIRDPLEEAGSLMGRQGAEQEGVFEGLWSLGAQWAGRVGLTVVP